MPKLIFRSYHFSVASDYDHDPNYEGETFIVDTEEDPNPHIIAAIDDKNGTNIAVVVLGIYEGKILVDIESYAYGHFTNEIELCTLEDAVKQAAEAASEGVNDEEAAFEWDSGNSELHATE
jgi:glutamine amidotransferase-like uncharacterized protein